MNFHVVKHSIRNSSERYEARRRDHISHFLLRLYCCTSEELRKWFIWHESEYLWFQLMDGHSKQKTDMSDFMRYNNLKYPLLTDVETIQLLYDNNLLYAGKRPADKKKDETKKQDIHVIPFEMVPALIKKRRVFLMDGLAYVPSKDMLNIICSEFKLELKKSLASMSRRLMASASGVGIEEDRMIPRFNSIYHELVTKADNLKRNEQRTGNRPLVTPDMIDDLAQEHFPPCMRNIHLNLRKDHHIKHYARLYFGLFLKGIGMRVEDCLEFFKSEFIHHMTPEKFTKEHGYNIRYNYGLEGKKVSLSAYSCHKIINQNPPGPGDCHGCPFKHFDETNLTSLLKKFGASDTSFDDIKKSVKDHDYTGACTRFLLDKYPQHQLPVTDRNGILRDGKIYHPNQFYVESRRAKYNMKNPYVPDVNPDQNVTPDAPAADGVNQVVNSDGTTATDSPDVQQNRDKSHQENAGGDVQQDSNGGNDEKTDDGTPADEPMDQDVEEEKQTDGPQSQLSADSDLHDAPSDLMTTDTNDTQEKE